MGSLNSRTVMSTKPAASRCLNKKSALGVLVLDRGDRRAAAGRADRLPLQPDQRQCGEAEHDECDHDLDQGDRREGAQVDADLERRLALLVAPRVEGGAWVARGGLDDGRVVHFLQLDVAPWFGVGVRLLEESRPVAYAACHGAHVDQVEVVQWPGPVCFCVVDFIFDVWGDPTLWSVLATNDTVRSRPLVWAHLG